MFRHACYATSPDEQQLIVLTVAGCVPIEKGESMSYTWRLVSHCFHRLLLKLDYRSTADSDAASRYSSHSGDVLAADRK